MREIGIGEGRKGEGKLGVQKSREKRMFVGLGSRWRLTGGGVGDGGHSSG